MTNKWLEAAARYKAAKQPSFRSRPEAEKPVPTLAEFLANDEGKAARKLLAAMSEQVRLGYDTSKSGTTVVILDADGLKTCSGERSAGGIFVGEQPAYIPIEPTKAVELIRTFEEGSTLLAGHNEDEMRLSEMDERDLVLALRNELDKLAAKAP
jgi:hypothetical protein